MCTNRMEWNRKETIDYFKQNPYEYLKEYKGTFVYDKAHDTVHKKM